MLENRFDREKNKQIRKIQKDVQKDAQKDQVRKRLTEYREASLSRFTQLTHERLTAINDGVIAIILTIMALEIRAPESQNAMPEFSRQVLVFLVSFFIVAGFWYDNHFAFTTFEKAKGNIVVLNFLFLAVLTLIPVMSKWLMSDVNFYAIVGFGGVYFLASVINAVIFAVANRHDSEGIHMSTMLWGRVGIVVAINTILIGLAWFSPFAAMLLYIVLPIYTFIVHALRV